MRSTSLVLNASTSVDRFVTAVEGFVVALDMWQPPAAPDPTYRPAPQGSSMAGLASLRAGAAAQGTLYPTDAKEA